MSERPTGDEAFDQIVQALDMDHLVFPTETETETSTDQIDEPVEFDDMPDDVDDQFYRRVPPLSAAVPGDRRTVLAWLAAVGAPVVMMVCTFADVWLWPPVIWTLCALFVGGSVWLFARLPSSRRDWDDGSAV